MCHFYRNAYFDVKLGQITDAIALVQQWRSRIWVEMLFALRRVKFCEHILASLVGCGIGLLFWISPWVALGLVTGVIFCIVALSKPIILCYLMIAAVALTGGVERSRLLPLLRPNELTLLLSAILAFPVILADKHRCIRVSRYVIIALVILISGTVFIPAMSYLLRGTQLSISDMFTLLAPLQYILLFWLFAYVPGGEQERREIIQWMLFCGSIVAVVGLMQAARIDFVAKMLNRWYASDHTARATQAGASRVTSLMAAWNALGIFLMVNILISWALLPSIEIGVYKVNLIGAMILSALCLLVSGSFAGVFGLIIGALLTEVFVQRGIRSLPILVVIVVGVLVSVLFLWPFIKPLIRGRLNFQYRHGGIIPQTLVFRFHVWRNVFCPVIRDNILLGVSLTIPSTFAWHAFESQYLLLLYYFGLGGLIAHLFWLGLMLYWLYQRLRKSGVFLRAIVTGTLSVLVVLSIAGLTNAVFTFSGAADYLWIMFALISGSEEIA